MELTCENCGKVVEVSVKDRYQYPSMTDLVLEGFYCEPCKTFDSFAASLPSLCTVDVRIVDNVMDNEDWGVDRLIINAGHVVAQDRVFGGIYAIPDMVGWSVSQLCEWSKYDNAGSFPENGHEIRVVGRRI